MTFAETLWALALKLQFVGVVVFLDVALNYWLLILRRADGDGQS
jgi:hypothetical protein